MALSERTRAEARYAAAQLAEKRAREAGDLPGIDKAKAEQVAAMNEVAAIDLTARTGSDEERVTLLAANPYANVVDANGVEFKNGRAEGVRRSVAVEYTRSLEWYSIEGEGP